MSGHVQIDGRDYLVRDPAQLGMQSANQMAAKLGSGGQEYDDLENWTVQLWNNWQGGVGKKDPSAGGFLFATLDTRFDGEINLPPMLFKEGQASDGAHQYDSSLTIGSGQTYTRVANSFVIDDTAQYVTVLLPGSAYGGSATQVKVELWSDTGGNPNAMVQSQTVTLRADLGHFYHLVTFTTFGGAPLYHIVIYPVSGTLTLLGKAGSSGTSGRVYNGSSWAEGFSASTVIHENSPGLEITKIVSFNGEVLVASSVNLYRIDQPGSWDHLKGYPTAITDLLAVGSTLYIGLGDSTNYETMSTSDVFTAGTVPARLFALWKGYLYRAVANSVYYTANETTWLGPFEMCFNKYSVRGLAGFGDDLYAGCDDGLYRLAPGDIAQKVQSFGGVSQDNGKHMLNWQGNLYFSLGVSLVRYDGASFLPQGLDLGEGLPNGFAGGVTGLAANNNWLVCATRNSLWVHNGQGWHFLQRCPGVISCIGYLTNQFTDVDAWPEDAVIGIGTSVGTYYAVQLPDTGRSNYRSSEDGEFFRYHPSGYLEQARFYGGLREVLKDCESMYVDGDGLSTTAYIDVYWQDEGSSDWELLARIDSDTEEQRWSDYDTRPNTRWIKLKLVFTGLDSFAAFRAIAVRLKFMNMVTDRQRWYVPVVVSDRQEMLDKSRNPYNASQMNEHIKQLITQIPPFIYRDLDGDEYEAKILSYSRNIEKFTVDAATEEVRFVTVWGLTLEQVTRGAYAAA